jgi:hypothetical protein
LTKILKKLEKNLKFDSKTVIHYTQKLIDTYTIEYYRDINYCRADLTRHLILLKAVNFFAAKKDLTFEKLINFIPDNISSRSYRIQCVNDLCKRKILERKKVSKDKRLINIYPTEQTMNLYCELHLSYKNTLYNL